MKLIHLLCCLFLLNCGLFCDDDDANQGYTTKLSKTSPFTASILVPDAYRKTPTTVFFGMISPTTKDPIPFEAPVMSTFFN